MVRWVAKDKNASLNVDFKIFLHIRFPYRSKTKLCKKIQYCHWFTGLRFWSCSKWRKRCSPRRWSPCSWNESWRCKMEPNNLLTWWKFPKNTLLKSTNVLVQAKFERRFHKDPDLRLSLLQNISQIGNSRYNWSLNKPCTWSQNSIKFTLRSLDHERSSHSSLLEWLIDLIS